MVTSGCCIITGQIRNKTGITLESAQSIPRDLSMWHMCAIFLPSILMDNYIKIRKIIMNSLNDQNEKQSSCRRLLLGMNASNNDIEKNHSPNGTPKYHPKIRNHTLRTTTALVRAFM
jgi:hypothetical protein